MASVITVVALLANYYEGRRFYVALIWLCLVINNLDSDHMGGV